MTKKPKQRKKLPKKPHKPKEFSPVGEFSMTPVVPRQYTRWQLLAGDRQFVGAMRWTLTGCFAAGAFFSAALVYRPLGKLYVYAAHSIIGLVPAVFIPPGTYIPGVFVPPTALMIIAAFTIFGYLKGSEPPDIEPRKEKFTFGENLAVFIICIVFAIGYGYARSSEGMPNAGIVEVFSHPVFLIGLIIIVPATFYYAFAPRHSQGLMIFGIMTALTVCCVGAFLGMFAYTLIAACLHAMNQ